MDLKKTLGKRAPDGAWEIPIVGEIGFFGTNGEDLIRELNAVRPDKVKFVIYSPGGAVYDAIAVAGYIRDKNIECFAEIYGVCASAATVFAALAGPKNTSIAPGSMFLIHMPFGGDQKLIDNATEFLSNLYSTAYGWSRSEAKKHMEADDGRGIFWTAKEAKSMGLVSEIMEGTKVAAHYNINTTAMAEEKKTITAKVKVKLTTMEAARAAFGEGTEVEVEVAPEEATAAVIGEKDARIAELEKENEDLRAKAQESEAGQEARAQLETEANAAKAALQAKEEEHTKALNALKASHEAAIAELKRPLAKKTVGDNAEGAIGEIPGAKQDEKAALISEIFAQMSPVQRAQHEAAMARKKAQQNKQ